MGLINSSENGATERPGSSNKSLAVFMAGPIRYWWRPEVEGTNKHYQYTMFRKIVHATLSDEFLVYAPNLAWRGPWDDRAQLANNFSISISDVFLYLYMDDVPAEGTREESIYATHLGLTMKSIDCTYPPKFYEELKTVRKELLEIRNKMFGQ